MGRVLTGKCLLLLVCAEEATDGNRELLAALEAEFPGVVVGCVPMLLWAT